MKFSEVTSKTGVKWLTKQIFNSYILEIYKNIYEKVKKINFSDNQSYRS